MDKDQKRAINRASCVVEDLLSITIGDLMFFLRRHVGPLFSVCVDDGAVATGQMSSVTDGFYGPTTYGRTRVARQLLVSALAEHHLRLGKLHDERT